MTDLIDQTLKELEQDSSKLLENLTGGQIQEVLDFLVIQAIKPIILRSNIFDSQIIYLLGLVTKNRKRKLSSLPREEFISILCQYLSTTDLNKKVALLEIAKIERGFLYNFVVNVLEKLNSFDSIYTTRLLCTNKLDRLRLDKKLQVIAKSVGLTSEQAYLVGIQSKDYLELAYSFRNSIVNNYVRYCYKQAKIFCASKSNSFDFQDVWHNFLMSITKAIDKYDCSKGALTSYIKWWILNVQTASPADHGHEYGTAYTIPQLQRKALATKNKDSINFSLSLNTILTSDGSEAVLKDYVTKESGLDESLEKEQDEDIIKYLIKKADVRSGLARLYLDVSEYFSEKEMKKMLLIMKEQNTLTKT